ncbi:MAG TPA: GAF domain-containing SpoIIE family protein phosphatase [Thermoanaerobaculia bacterium]|nr:GAF domain-containing SpoIIE family protein phosphatase [Thermoanaerobaculia bacterium]
MQINDERRRAERLLLIPPLAGRIHGCSVAVHEIGLLGSRIEHETPLVGSGPDRLTLVWDGEEITVDCTIAHSERLPVNGGERFVSGLSFKIGTSDGPKLQRVIESLATREEVERLKKIVEASKLINSTIEADTLFTSILAAATNELGVERGTLYFVDDERHEIWSKVADGLDVREIRLPIGKGLAGTVAATGEEVILHDAYADPRFDQSQDKRSGYRTRSMLCVPIRNRAGKIVGVLQLLNKKQGSFGARDLEFLDSISDHMAIAMENATLHRNLLEKNRMEQELKLGREIQRRLLPPPPCDIADTQLSARSVPCFEVGGDYYDFIEFAGGDLGIVIADVSGKGVAAAMIMSSVQSALRMAAPMADDLAELMTRLNALLYRMAGGRKYVTFFFGRYNPESGELRYVNAGHNPPFVIADSSIEPLMSTGRPIGILPEATYHEAVAMLPANATLFLYTDGLNEANNPDEQEFGMDRLKELLAKTAAEDIEQMPDSVLSAIAAFENGAHASDDKTIVVLRRSS